jgi:hypothetical protein
MQNRTVTFRYPYNGDKYTAEGALRIRVERGDQWGYFDDQGRWLEGPLRSADPTFCRYLSSSWLVDQDPLRWGLVSQKRQTKA